MGEFKIKERKPNIKCGCDYP